MSTVPTDNRLRRDAIAIWQAGVDAVNAERLVQSVVRFEGSTLSIAGEQWAIDRVGRIAVVGGGKAGAGMAAGFEQAVGDDFLTSEVTGWVNVPADCVRPLKQLHLHPARPAGLNEPTEEGVVGAEKILKIVSQLSRGDVCVVLLSGGGSALLPAPVGGISLSDKQVVTRGLMQAGASIDELNCVRKHLSRIKGGRLAQACTAGKMITLIISDVIGDPLDVIASGPTVADSTTAADALAVLQKFAPSMPDVPANIFEHLKEAAQHEDVFDQPIQTSVRNVIIGNIDVAISAAAHEAAQRGYDVESLGGKNAGIAREVGRDLTERCLRNRNAGEGPRCLLSGGEPVVRLVATDSPRLGGRNQELVLSAAVRLWNEDASDIVILSGGTDGEDGPTDAAGAFVDASVLRTAHKLGINPSDYLAINNSYPFFASTHGHLTTGPTHTNVMDLRVCLTG
ncbi:MAG: DUF4147 domain-containing protein [Planctomycetaceae bacterium]|nr:DUF4147 domain-containing protein [Planctomycetaceae bacterium]